MSEISSITHLHELYELLNEVDTSETRRREVIKAEVAITLGEHEDNDELKAIGYRVWHGNGTSFDKGVVDQAVSYARKF